MQFLALIVNPDRTQNSMLANYFGASTEIECVEFSSEAQAMEWLARDGRRVDVIFLPWIACSTPGGIVDELRRREATRDALLYAIATLEEHERMRASFAASEMIDHILIKPFRARELVRRIERSLRAPLTAESAALVIDEDGEAREIVRDCLGSVGIVNVVQMVAVEEALQQFKASTQQYALVVTTAELSGHNDFRLQHQMRQSPRMAGLPLVMVTSQLSLDQLRHMQEAAVSIAGFVLAPFEPKSFKQKVDEIAARVYRNRIARMAEAEAQKFLREGQGETAIQCLEHATKKISDVGFLFEAMGDLLRVQKADPGRVSEAYEKALQLTPYRAELIGKCAETYLTLGKVADAIRIRKAYLYRLGYDDSLRTELAKNYLQTGDYGAAAVELRRALNCNPSNGAAESLLQVASSLEEKKEEKKKAA